VIRTPHFSPWVIFAAPAMVGVLSLAGLIAALIGDGVWDVVGGLMLGASIATLVWALIARRHR